MIQNAARIIMEQHGGRFPNTYDEILALPGIGAYTAGAIASTAFNIAVPCIDGNAERVLSRLFDIGTPVRTEPAKSRIRGLAAALIPDGLAREFNQSLMELGALVCTKSPKCAVCPLAPLCQANLLGIVDQRPVPAPGKHLVPLTTVCGLLIRDDKILLRRRPHDGGIWGGLMMFPDTRVEIGETPIQALTRTWVHSGLSVTSAEQLMIVRHKYTAYDITLHALKVTADGPPSVSGFEWVDISALDATPLPAPHRRIAKKLIL
jgi:A/G-specific adenine glycosylase